MKYNIVCHRGCTTDCIEVNGKNTADMGDEELANVICDLLRAGYYPDFAYLQELIENIAESNGKIETLYQCDQCGDTVTKTTLNAD